MIELGVNIDHVATLREVRKTIEPDPVYAAVEAELGGADGITIHLREDRRHIQERDLKLLRQIIKTKLNLEMALNDEVIKIALDVKPDIVCIVPERREEITTEGGLDAKNNKNKLKETIKLLNKEGILVSVFVDPEKEQIEICRECGAQYIELHTGSYANSFHPLKPTKEYDKLKESAIFAYSIGLIVNAGHGLNYQNVGPICKIPHINELNIGHSIIGRSIFIGLRNAVKEMKEIIMKWSK